jgi:hypothetical protein
LFSLFIYILKIRNKSNESLRTKIKELDDQGLNFSRDFKIGNFHHKRTEIEWLRGEIEKDKTTNNKVGTSDDFESAHALHGRLAELNKEKNTSPQKPETQEIEKNQPEPAPVPEVKQEIKTQEYTKEEEKLLKDFYNFSAKIRRLPEGKKVSGFLTDLNNFGLRIQNLDNTKTKAFLQSEFASIEMEIHSRNNTETRPDPVPVSEDKKENKKEEPQPEMKELFLVSRQPFRPIDLKVKSALEKQGIKYAQMAEACFTQNLVFIKPNEKTEVKKEEDHVTHRTLP